MAASSVLLLLATVALSAIVSQAYYLEKRMPDASYMEPRADTKKRPFCNAFTGCGRKRSNMPAIPSIQEPQEEPENLGTLLDLSAEPAVEGLSRQIMSEAKLWEAIQEANMEIMRQKQEADTGAQLTLPASGRLANPKCALPSCVAI